MSLELISNLKYITSNTAPTTSTLARGELAFGFVNGELKLYCNANDEIINLIDVAMSVRTVAGRTGDVVLSKSDVGLSNVDNVLAPVITNGAVTVRNLQFQLTGTTLVITTI